MKTFKVERWYKKSKKVLFKSDNRDEAIAFKAEWTKKNGVKLHLVEVE